MTTTQMIIGSLSNDLMRVANCKANNSQKAANRFAQEAKRWAKDLRHRGTENYIKEIANLVYSNKSGEVSMKLAEDYLMYAILLQNHVSHSLNRSS